jgi:hypothetical protein
MFLMRWTFPFLAEPIRKTEGILFYLIGHLSSDLSRRLVLAQPFINHLAQQIVVGPGQKT